MRGCAHFHARRRSSSISIFDAAESDELSDDSTRMLEIFQQFYIFARRKKKPLFPFHFERRGPFCLSVPYITAGAATHGQTCAQGF